MPNPAFIQTISLMEEKEQKIEYFKAIRLKIASPEEILSWSYGEVTKPETINYRTQKPERDGLFCEKIFGPIKDWQCSCGKYKKIRYRGSICDRCGVEVTRSRVRKERMGHITLATPVAHIWFLRGVPSKIGLILDLSTQTLEKVVYFANFIITKVDEEIKKSTLEQLKEDFKNREKLLKKEIKNKEKFSKEYQILREKFETTKKEIEEIKPKKLLSEADYHKLSLKYGYFFEAGIGAEAILTLLANLNLKKLISQLEKEKQETDNPARRKKIIFRLKLIKNLLNQKIKPDWMILKILPVIPPELRPMVPLDGERFASSDLNDLYRRVINRNNRLKRLIELQAPEVICRNEKRMLQEAVDALIDQKMRKGKTVTTGMSKRPLKSLADNLRGKQGRFRQNLLGKRVDYSGRSVIVVGPELKLDECGLPKIIARELFRPFIISKLIQREIVHNVKSASRFIDSGANEVWDILEEIVKQKYVLLNRAPTLHRLGIMAFKPILIEGKAIQIHPLVCHAFNADFDGDQMAVHLPLTTQSQKEAKEILLSTVNLLKPATGEPVVTPTKDMVWGAFWLTLIIPKKLAPVKDKERLDKKFFSSRQEAFLAYENGYLEIHDEIILKNENRRIETSIGRLIFETVLPREIKIPNKTIDIKILKEIIIDCYQKLGPQRTAQVLDEIKEITFKYLTLSGLSWGLDDLPEISHKKKIITEAEKEIDEIQKQYEEGLLAEDERYLKNLDVWIKVRDQIAEICHKILPPTNPILSMIKSGARGTWSQLNQMLGIKGLVSSPTGQIIELPIKSSLQEGFSVLEYFISTHGARKGVSDTALRTASAGYLTRRMIDVAQDVTIVEEDCGDKKGIIWTKEESEEVEENLVSRIFGRMVLENIVQPKTKKILVKEGEFVEWKSLKEIEKINLKEIRVRTVLSCKSRWGVCAKCYGFDLGYNQPVKVGTAVGIIAAQSIGEPGTQLTLRTFHTGGVVGRDITQGLPRINELLEVRSPKRKSILAQRDYLKVEKIEGRRQKKITLKYLNSKNQEDKEVITIPSNYLLRIKEGQKIAKGTPLTDGSFDLHEFYQLKGKEAVQKYILKEVKHIYYSQGQKVNDKHIEIIIRQLFSRRLVEESGETDLLPGEILPQSYIEEINEKVVQLGKKPAKVKELLMGMSRVALTTQSFLSAASFQESSRVLIDAAVTGRPDPLLGLKENVIIGRLISIKKDFLK